MNAPVLSNSDIDTLLKSLTATKENALLHAMLQSLTEAASSGDHNIERVTRAMDEAQRKADQEEEPIILLKAKLIHMRDAATLAEAKNFLTERENES